MAALQTPDQIRHLFSQAMSAMYRQEVPQYGTLLDIVQQVNRQTLQADPALRQRLEAAGELHRLDVERHGAIRLGTAQELATMRRIFAVMGMHPVGYYDLSVAGVPVHATAFRPVDDASLRLNPFRVFTSLLRLELLGDQALRAQAQAILAARNIFTAGAIALTEKAEAQGGLSEEDAQAFVREATETFRWHSQSTVTLQTYRQLHAAHRLVADVVCFKGPHINHLTPRTLDIDAVQAEMPRHGLAAKDVIEGPPRRRHPILLRQTSFQALQEPIRFAGAHEAGSHTARFGEIEQRGMALTRQGRALYDELLAQVRGMDSAQADAGYAARLSEVFCAFPDDLPTLRQRGLAFFRYGIADDAAWRREAATGRPFNLPLLCEHGVISATPIVYEDFLPVSAAGIFQSNLQGTARKHYASQAAQAEFEAALQAPVLDEIQLYADSQQASIDALQRHWQALSAGMAD